MILVWISSSISSDLYLDIWLAGKIIKFSRGVRSFLLEMGTKTNGRDVLEVDCVV
jgi:hypothetical protein